MPERDLALLAAHHSAPRYREAVSLPAQSMGKQGTWRNWNKADGQSQWGEGSASSWQYWPGAWPKATKGQGQYTDASNFPSYHNMDVQPSSAAVPPQTADVPAETNEDVETGRIKTVQRWLNTIRKADARLRKTRDAQAQRELQWKKYESEMQKNFASQRKQFLADTQRAQQDLKEIREQKQAAVSQLQACMQEPDVVMPESPTAALSTEDQHYWDMLMQEPVVPPAEDVDTWIQKTLQHASKYGPHAITEADKVKVQQWLSQHGTLPVTAPAHSSPDPWGSDGVADAELQQALAQSLLVQTAKAPHTPVRAPLGAPRTPQPVPRLPKAPNASTVPQSFPVASTQTSTRLTPFPPPMPASAKPHEGLAVPSGTEQAAADPYLYSSPVTATAASAVTTGSTASPGAALGVPKIPKQRLSVKHASRPTGPVTPDTRAERSATLDAKRAALTQEAVKAPQHFLLDDDGDATVPPPGIVSGDQLD